MQKQLVVNDEALLAGAEAIAADMKLPGGRRLKLAKIIDGHLEWFDLARRRGLEWSDIVAVLYKAGVTRPDGRPLSRGHISSLVWRKKDAFAYTQTAFPKNKEISSQFTRTEYEKKLKDSAWSDRVRQGAAGHSSTAKLSQGKKGTDDQTEAAQNHNLDQEKNNLIAYMKRAARLRKGD